MIIRSVAILVLAVLPVITARGDDVFGDETGSGYQSDQQPWREGRVSIPALPREDKLLSLSVDNSPFSYFIDRSSVSVGADDHVVRYTAVVVSRSGVRNVLYEGIRCDTRQYHTYAVGVGDGPLQRNAAARWEPIRGTGSFRYRLDLYKYYVCDGFYPRASAAEILERIKYPPAFQ